MNNYSKIITFFMENGVQLTKEQLITIKEEFLEEITNDGGPKTEIEQEIIRNNPKYSLDQRKSDIHNLMSTKYSKYKSEEKRNENTGDQADRLRELKSNN